MEHEFSFSFYQLCIIISQRKYLREKLRNSSNNLMTVVVFANMNRVWIKVQLRSTYEAKIAGGSQLDLDRHG